MYPILFSIGSLTVTSFGLFLSLAFFAAVFVVWRLGKTYDLNENKILDLIILTFLGGLIGARVYFVFFNWGLFGDLSKTILINRYPGLSFWGGLVGGILVLKFFTARFKINFWQVADFAAVGYLIGIVFGDIGCFLSGCSYGVVSSLPIATPVVGLLGKRFPIALLESVILLIIFFYLWGLAVKFHFAGKIAAYFLVLLGLVKFFSEFGRGDSIHYGYVYSLLLIIFGVFIFYQRSKRSIVTDLKILGLVVLSAKKRQITLLHFQKNWYNHKVDLKIKIGKAVAVLRRLNVRLTPKNLR